MRKEVLYDQCTRWAVKCSTGSVFRLKCQHELSSRILLTHIIYQDMQVMVKKGSRLVEDSDLHLRLE